MRIHDRTSLSLTCVSRCPQPAPYRSAMVTEPKGDALSVDPVSGEDLLSMMGRLCGHPAPGDGLRGRSPQSFRPRGACERGSKRQEPTRHELGHGDHVPARRLSGEWIHEPHPFYLSDVSRNGRTLTGQTMPFARMRSDRTPNTNRHLTQLGQHAAATPRSMSGVGKPVHRTARHRS